MLERENNGGEKTQLLIVQEMAMATDKNTPESIYKHRGYSWWVNDEKAW